MQVPVETKPALWGAVCGAAVMAFIGFSWGGWVTGSAAESAATLRASGAVTAALAPMCVARFQASADMTTHLAALKKVDTWSQGDFIEKGGWATMPGPVNPPEQVSAVAKACATLLLA